MRSYHGVSYDLIGERVLIFGGLELVHPQVLSGSLLGDLWAYDVGDDRWTEMEVDGGPETPCAAPDGVRPADRHTHCFRR